MQWEVKRLRRELKQAKEALSDMAIKAMVLESMLDICRASWRSFTGNPKSSLHPLQNSAKRHRPSGIIQSPIHG